MWPLKSITSARSIIESASASICFEVIHARWMVVCPGRARGRGRARAVRRVAADAGPARILAEEQRLDRDRHGERRHAHAAQVDVVEVPERDAVDHQHFGGDCHSSLRSAPKVCATSPSKMRKSGVAVHQRHGQRLDDARASAASRA
jgi:hypothetical protein